MKRIISWGRAKVKYFLNIGIIKNNSFANFFLHNIKKFKIDNVYNYCEYYKKPKNKVNNKSALISYLPKPLIPQKSKRDRTRFSNLGIAQYIPRALNELGYIVDIISYDDMAFFPKKNYDLFIGHGGINFEKLSKSLPEKTVQIYFSTGVYWKEFNIKEAKRLYDLAKRRGFLLKPDRSINHSEEFANKSADGIIVLGNKNAVESYRQFSNVVGINNAVFPIDWSGYKNKDFEEGRNHFLFFSGGGNIHKGLDLLLEAFSGLDLHLHICQDIDADFFRVYEYELTRQPNIHRYGSIKMRSKQFKQLAIKCNWVVSATACEGQPGAILECMGHGLIPIVNKETNIDIKGLGITLPDESIDEICSVIENTSQIDVKMCQKMAAKNIEEINSSYLPENFNQNLKNAIRKITSQKRIQKKQ